MVNYTPCRKTLHKIHFMDSDKVFVVEESIFLSSWQSDRMELYCAVRVLSIDSTLHAQHATLKIRFPCRR